MSTLLWAAALHPIRLYKLHIYQLSLETYHARIKFLASSIASAEAGHNMLPDTSNLGDSSQ